MNGMDEETMSAVMFWVGAMFAVTPILVVATIVGTTWYLRRRRKSGAVPPART
jgi:uncharacterized membrane protein